MVKKKATARAVSARIRTCVQKRRGARLLLPSMNFLGSSARSANTRVFCQYLCKYSKNTDKSHSKRIFSSGESFRPVFSGAVAGANVWKITDCPRCLFLSFRAVRLLKLHATLRNLSQYAARLFPGKRVAGKRGFPIHNLI